MIGRRGVVGVLGGVSAGIAGLVGAVSLTRIAGDYLGFPPGLEWTLTGAVDVAGVAGGVMWTAFQGPVRAIGRPMSVVCTAVSGIGVGLDHATHAGRVVREQAPAAVSLPGLWWPVVAFVAGVFIPALLTWLLHALAVIGDEATPGAGVPGSREVGAGLSRDDRDDPRPQVRDAVAGMGWDVPTGTISVDLPGHPSHDVPADPPAAPTHAAHPDDLLRDAVVWASRDARDGDAIPGWRSIQKEFPGLTESRARRAAREAKRPGAGARLRRVQ